MLQNNIVIQPIGVIIIGAGGFCKQVIDVFELNGVKILGILDDKRTEPLLNYSIIGTVKGYNITHERIFCAIGDVNVRKTMFSAFPPNWINCIHPNASISKYSQMGMGNYIGPKACIMPGVKIGNNNILDPMSLLSHDVILGSHNHVAGHGCLLGRVRIGDCNLIGANSTILPNLKLDNDNILGAGGVCTKSVNSNKILMGVPAKDIIQ